MAKLEPTKVESLRLEILESQKARMDFLKFKLIAIAALGAIGLGLQTSNLGKNINLVLCLIPFVGLYVDILCYHNVIRILIIGEYLKKEGDGYEIFISKLCEQIKNKKNKSGRFLFNLEDLVIIWTTIGVSVLLFIYGFYAFCTAEVHTEHLYKIVFFIAGFGGLLGSYLAKKQFKKRERILKKESKVNDSTLES